jgi:hypothetical protein
LSIGFWETLASANGDGTAVTAVGPSSLLGGPAATGLYSMAANRLRVGDVISLRASGIVSSAVTTPGTYRWSVNYGGTAAVFDSLAITPISGSAQTNIPWLLDIEGIVRTVGPATTATIYWQGYVFCLAISVTVPMITVPTTTAVGAGFNTTVVSTVDFQWTQTVTTGSITLHNYSLSLKTSSGF